MSNKTMLRITIFIGIFFICTATFYFHEMLSKTKTITISTSSTEIEEISEDSETTVNRLLELLKNIHSSTNSAYTVEYNKMTQTYEISLIHPGLFNSFSVCQENNQFEAWDNLVQKIAESSKILTNIIQKEMGSKNKVRYIYSDIINDIVSPMIICENGIIIFDISIGVKKGE